MQERHVYLSWTGGHSYGVPQLCVCSKASGYTGHFPASTHITPTLRQPWVGVVLAST